MRLRQMLLEVERKNKLHGAEHAEVLIHCSVETSHMKTTV